MIQNFPIRKFDNQVNFTIKLTDILVWLLYIFIINICFKILFIHINHRLIQDKYFCFLSFFWDFLLSVHFWKYSLQNRLPVFLKQELKAVCTVFISKSELFSFSARCFGRVLRFYMVIFYSWNTPISFSVHITFIQRK